MSAHQATGAGGEAAPVVDAAAPASDPIEALADSFFDDAEEEQDGAPPAADANEGGLTAEDADDEGEAAKPIDPPVSWTAEEKEHFKTLPPEVQETLSRREAEREKFVQSKATEAATARQAAEREAIAQVQTIAQQHAQYLQA